MLKVFSYFLLGASLLIGALLATGTLAVLQVDQIFTGSNALACLIAQLDVILSKPISDFEEDEDNKYLAPAFPASWHRWVIITKWITVISTASLLIHAVFAPPSFLSQIGVFVLGTMLLGPLAYRIMKAGLGDIYFERVFGSIAGRAFWCSAIVVLQVIYWAM